MNQNPLSVQPITDQESLQYLELQGQQRQLLQELKAKDPSLFKKMLRAGVFAMLGAISAHLLQQDTMTGAAVGGALSFLLPNKQKASTKIPYMIPNAPRY